MPPGKLHGLLVLDKPPGITSRAALDRAQGWFPRGTRVGHTGTLDPLATGVLVACIGVATRLTEYIQDMDKVYRADILLGARSDTDDADGTVASTGAQPVDETTMRRELATFVGEIDQVPPAYSAAKVTGRRAHQLARQGREVLLAPRKVRIDEVRVLRYEFPHLEVQVRCGKGTYIRSLARDLGERLHCGGLIASLRRLRVGAFTVERAISLDVTAAEAHASLQPPAQAVCDLPALHLAADKIEQLRKGQPVPWQRVEPAGELAVFGPDEALAGIVRHEKGHLRAVRVLAY